MAIFKIDKNKVTKCSIKDDGFGSEFGLRDFFADNLDDLLGVRFIEKEFPILEGRIDTLGLDENNSPVIIEYKWKENDEVLAQGLFYYNWLLKNKKTCTEQVSIQASLVKQGGALFLLGLKRIYNGLI